MLAIIPIADVVAQSLPSVVVFGSIFATTAEGVPISVSDLQHQQQRSFERLDPKQRVVMSLIQRQSSPEANWSTI